MSLSAREQEVLDRIAGDLAGPDSNLAAMLDTFTRLSAGEQMPQDEEIRHPSRPAGCVRKHGPRSRRLRKWLTPEGAPRSLSWLSAAVILAVTAIIAITVALSGGAKMGVCGSLRGLTCASQVHAYPSPPHQAGMRK